MNKQQKDLLLVDISKVAAKHGANNFIFVYSHVIRSGQVLDEIEISSISKENDNGPCKAFFQWLRRQIILKLQ